MLDIERFATAAHAHGVPLIVDNTFPTPVFCRPIEWGADIVTHSTTKYMDGHGVGVGGAIVDSGNFDWMAHADKFPGLTTPDESYHGIVYAEKFGQAGAFITKATSQLMRDLGSIQSPQNAFYLNMGLESLHVRMPQHFKNGLAVAEYLEKSDKVTSVRFPHLPSDPYYALAQKYLPEGGSGVVSFELAGGRAAAEKFMAALRLAAIETHVADARTCCLHPASATHRQMNDEELAAAGISPAMVRFSCGLEGTEDLIADIEQALAAIRGWPWARPRPSPALRQLSLREELAAEKGAVSAQGPPSLGNAFTGRGWDAMRYVLDRATYADAAVLAQNRLLRAELFRPVSGPGVGGGGAAGAQALRVAARALPEREVGLPVLLAPRRASRRA